MGLKIGTLEMLTGKKGFFSHLRVFLPRDIECLQLSFTSLRINATWRLAAAFPPRRAAVIHIHLHFHIHRRTEESKDGRTRG